MNLYPVTERIELARIYHPSFMTRSVYCPVNELLFYALSVTLECAHALHNTGDFDNSAVALDAINVLLQIDPLDTLQLETDLVAIGFHIASPITGKFIPENLEETPRKETTQP